MAYDDRSLTRHLFCCLVLTALAGFAACQDGPTSVREPTGGLALDVQLVAPSAALDGGRVIIRGPTDTTVGILPGTTDTVGGVLPGEYDVALEGLIGGEVEVFGQASEVQVVEGESTVAGITLFSFRPQLATLTDTFPSATVQLAFSGVAGADSYVVELDTSTTFATAHEASATDTSVSTTLEAAGLYHVRVRALNAYGGRGRPSERDSTDVVFAVFSSVSVGARHVCGVSDVGDAYCWGSPSWGKLGTAQENIVPRKVLGSIAFDSVSASLASHTCGRAQDGRVFCWGRNRVGQLGNGTTNDSVPTPAEVSVGQDVEPVTAGHSHTCTIAQGDGYCWGSNFAGALGTGGANDETCAGVPCRTSPTLVAGGHLFSQISAGGFYSCAISTLPDGTYCWGYNLFATLGDGTTEDRSTPTEVSGGHSFVEVRAGSIHTCAVTDDGTGYCWGDNDSGQLGIGTSGGSSTVPLQVSGGLSFQSIEPGFGFSCGLTEDGNAYCWGSNDRGALGTGDDAGSLVPVPVTGGLLFTQISVGGPMACGLVADGGLYCWGGNENGQLGDGTTDDRNEPTKVLFSR